MEQLTDIAQYESIVERYRRSGCLTNDYLQARAGELISRGLLFADCHERNAYLFERKANCCRLYYYLNDLTASDEINASDSVVVLEILYRGKSFPVAEHGFLTSLGFKDNLVRDQYAAVYKDLKLSDQRVEGVTVRPADSLDEVSWACTLFNGVFDPYSGDFIPEDDFPALFENRQILIAHDESGKRLGALHQTFERNVAWISHVAVLPEVRGRHVGQALLDAYVELNHSSDKSRYMLWVQQQNTAAVDMYRKKGFECLNKSTLSLIRIETTNCTK